MGIRAVGSRFRRPLGRSPPAHPLDGLHKRLLPAVRDFERTVRMRPETKISDIVDR